GELGTIAGDLAWVRFPDEGLDLGPQRRILWCLLAGRLGVLQAATAGLFALCRDQPPWCTGIGALGQVRLLEGRSDERAAAGDDLAQSGRHEALIFASLVPALAQWLAKDAGEHVLLVPASALAGGVI